MNEKKNKHLTAEDREQIQDCLNCGMTFKDIGKRIGKDQTTISKEVKKHICSHRNSFTNIDDCCPLLMKAPFVCNGCSKKSSSACHYVHRYYRATKAQVEYKALLHDAREGIPLNKESFYQTKKVIEDKFKEGQRIYHIIKTYKLPISESTVYRHIKKGYYDIGLIDLPRAVKFKARTKHLEKIPKCVQIGRTYEDFCEFAENHPYLSYSEMDTVIGRIGGKVILTLHLTVQNFMIGLLLDNKTSAQVSQKISELKQRLANKGFSFGDIYSVILTDNGGEFSQPAVIEMSLNQEIESHLFYCHPNSPYEKGKIEKNHTLFRDIVPKGTSFDDFTQETVNLIFSHVNSIKRPVFNGKTPFEMFCFTFSEELANALGIYRIPAEEVVQSPKLLKA